MRSPIVHGCYDLATLNTLCALGIRRFGFDLRATGTNLIPFKLLQSLLAELTADEIILTFADDRVATVLSFVDLLKHKPFKILLEFRDAKELAFYHSINLSFLWMFNPQADWRNILLLPKLKGVLLPFKYKHQYQKYPELWDILNHQGIEVFLHASNLEEAAGIADISEISLSLDLTAEVETTYRCVDQERLKEMPIWRKLNENSAL
jgi:hypothetical protein